MEKCTVIVNARDRFSTTTGCLEVLLANTGCPFDLIVVMGGVPERLQREWVSRFGGRSQFIFKPSFLNQAQARNIGLLEAKTRLAVLMDNDNYVRPGWLEPLVACQQETGAVCVVPVILESERKIHAAGNDIYMTYENGKAYGHKHLRFYGKILGQSSNLKRQRSDYAELHCQLVEVESTLRLGAYDENILEVGEVDQGLSLTKAGREIWFEPASAVRFALGGPIFHEDIRLFIWRWDMRAILRGYLYVQKKWNLDMTEHGAFRDFLLRTNSQLGLLPRLFPSRLALNLEKRLRGLRGLWVDLWQAPKQFFRRYKAWGLGYYAWPAPPDSRPG